LGAQKEADGLTAETDLLEDEDEGESEGESEGEVDEVALDAQKEADKLMAETDLFCWRTRKRARWMRSLWSRRC